MRVFLTGAAGFIGSHLAEALLERGDEVHALDNFDPFYPRAYKEANLELARRSPRFVFTEGDFRDAALLERLLAEARPEAILHLGARAGVRRSVEDPGGYVSVNVHGTTSLFEAARAAGIRKLLLASSSSVYADDSPAPFREDAPANRPASPYAATKKACEELAHAFHRVAGIDVVSLRYFTVYGPRQRPEMAIHKFARHLVAGREIPLYGGGRLERDYTFVGDAVAGTVAALDFLVSTGTCFEVFNLGNSHRVALNDLVELLERALGVRARIRYEDRPAGDVERTWADLTKARRVLGYDPQVGIEEGIRRFAEWFRTERPRLVQELGAPGGAPGADGARRAASLSHADPAARSAP